MKPLPTDLWDESLAKIVNDNRGRPLNVHKLMANHPQLLESWWPFRNYIVSGGALGRRQHELVVLRVAFRMRSWYEWAAHVDRGQKAGLVLEEIQRVRAGPDHPDWTVAESVLLRAIDECSSNCRISETTLLELEKYYTSGQIMDAIAIHGMYTILGLMINTWGLELDDDIQLPIGITKESWESEPRR